MCQRMRMRTMGAEHRVSRPQALQRTRRSGLLPNRKVETSMESAPANTGR
jgi:hypothetical protein